MHTCVRKLTIIASDNGLSPGRRQAIIWANAGILLIKGIKNGCPCIVEIRGTQGCALVGDPARAVGECRDVAKAQP